MQPDGPAMLALKTNHCMLHKGGVFTRQMANPVVGDHHGNCVFVVRIVEFRSKDPDDVDADPIRTPGSFANDMPQRILMPRLSDDLQRFPTTKHENVGLIGREGGPRSQIPNCIHASPPSRKLAKPPVQQVETNRAP